MSILDGTPLTSSLVEVADDVIKLLQDNADDLDLGDVTYGDQQKIHTTPLACVEPDNKATNLKGVPRVVSRRMTIYILMYHSAVTSPQANRRDADLSAEKVETLLNANPTLGGKLIHCLVENIESGYVTRDNTLYRASRITFRGDSQERLPNNL